MRQRSKNSRIIRRFERSSVGSNRNQINSQYSIWNVVRRRLRRLLERNVSGTLKIAEVTSRLVSFKQFCEAITKMGLEMANRRQLTDYFMIFEFRKIESNGLKWNPCCYCFFSCKFSNLVSPKSLRLLLRRRRFRMLLQPFPYLLLLLVWRTVAAFLIDLSCSKDLSIPNTHRIGVFEMEDSIRLVDVSVKTFRSDHLTSHRFRLKY
ncbi:hypothetical protein GCK72_016238 [Caenorhabditis remanei]|uniref:Ribosomal RNA-processing protein 8 n=1 Tax=Caenorhabditis remanei TaxID=31234 RepID=A0A6A5GYI9_CAERE|nr:hypothetical protein GCK72_016238 [Caenorhabditis remanei]KAF1759771.1 hypothetical protein GCK72_016238 [Caenorhabditis remanei]